MTELGLRPRSASELVDAAFQVFRRDPLPFIVASAVFYVPLLLIRLALDAPLLNGELDFPRLLTSAVITLVAYSVASAVTMRLASDVYLGRPTDLAGVFRAVAPKIPRVIAASLIVFMFMVIGFMLFLVPALYPLARFFAVRQSIVFENAGVGSSLSRSSSLSAGVKGHVLNTLILAGLIVLAITFGAGLASGMMGFRVLQFAIATGISVVVYPFLGIAQTLLYYDVRIRKEGFDIEYLASTAPVDASARTGA